ncbi:MAG TPA: beta-propeller domain-containing protein [Nitrososphaerales archaeon]|nr:beta-propeller domain-containing protein [Nitrososphaerales archaeon]
MHLSERGSAKSEMAVFVVVLVAAAALVASLTFASLNGAPKLSAAQAVPEGLGSFQSYAQLQQYVAANAKSAQQYGRYGVGFGGLIPGGGVRFPIEFGVALAAAQTYAAAGASTSPSFTGTNVQVQGVDEPDTVKTDGTHLFVSNQNSVSIINAYPPNSTGVIASLSFRTATVIGIEVAQGRLMVIDQRGQYVNTTVDLLLYDTSSIASPKLIQNVSVPGDYVAARMAQGFVYAVVQQPSYTFAGGNATAVMPVAAEGGASAELAPTSVYYTPNRAQVSYYTMISSINMTSGDNSIKSVLTGPSSTVYVSTSNIYVVYTNYPDLFMADGIPGDAYTGGVISASDVAQAQNSTILRASYDSGKVMVAAAGSVPGTTLNQFSMDEYNGDFRVATSRFATIGGTSTMSDDVYVLNENMSQVSSLVNIAPGENIYAVRFVGATGYVVTYQQIDPLFVISFQDVTHPAILSALKVNGYSDYLQPLPGGYLLGVGKDSVPASNGDYSFYLGLKLSLFHVFANGSSTQVSKLLIGDRGTDSPVLTDHLAFTYDPSRNVTVIPLTLYLVSGNQTDQSGIPAYGDPVWQGAYVIKVNDAGFTILGKVSQYPAGENFGDNPNGNLQIDRTVIIGDFLYTVSQGEVMVSQMSNFSTVATVALPS